MVVYTGRQRGFALFNVVSQPFIQPNMTRTIIQELEETAAFIRTVHSGKPRVGIILCSGLGNLSREIGNVQEIPYADIPNFRVSTVEAHQGKLISGTLNGQEAGV